ncbi:pentatricopeptide repeat-containing protein At4g21300-like [Nymphaea colorata]|uniref:DYW domain-containing protein n=1 Tax=Nymphaea colorata TaxID=210225 RepID=A0A5K1H141_9MAGN|nr:pentatricopeptide repeat-containing protein At4g21300-like [Nymphaea colorata]
MLLQLPQVLLPTSFSKTTGGRCHHAAEDSKGAPNPTAHLHLLTLLRGSPRLESAKQVHAHALKVALLPNDLALATRILSIYGNSGCSGDAHDLFRCIPDPDIVSWNSIIKAFGINCAWLDAVSLYSELGWSGSVRPNGLTFPAAIKACSKLMLLKSGKEIHCHVLRNGYLPDSFVGTSLISLYANCGRFENACRVFDGMPQRETASWNAMIGGSVQNGFAEEGLVFYRQMKMEGCLPDPMTVVGVLNACTALGDVSFGMCIHAEMLKLGLGIDVFVDNSLVDMYSKCGCVDMAVNVFNQMDEQNVVTWTALISCYCQHGEGDSAIEMFRQMLVENLFPNEFTLATLLQACAQRRYLQLVMMVHAYTLRNGFSMDKFLLNSLIDSYSKCGAIGAAEKMLDRMNCRDVVSWTSVITGCIDHKLIERAFMWAFRMQNDLVMPNVVTLTSLMRGCSYLNAPNLCRSIHGFVMKTEMRSDPTVATSLINMYTKSRSMDVAYQVFDKLLERSIDSWGAMIVGYVQSGSIGRALEIFIQSHIAEEYLSPETMATVVQGCCHEISLKRGQSIHCYLIKHGFLPCAVVENSLMDMYAKCKQVASACLIFDRMHSRDNISWNTMIECYARNDCLHEALRLLHEMNQHDDIEIDAVTMLSALQACIQLGSLRYGEILHGFIIRSGIDSDIFVQNSLLDMYAKAGRIDLAEQIFLEMPEKDLSSWNSMISAYGMHGDSRSALKIFAQLQEYGPTHPNDITFVSLLSAFGHSGNVMEGYQCFNSMVIDYGIEPSLDHYACVVDILGRSGRLIEAEEFINKMPLEPGSAVWGALLGACRSSRDVVVAERAAKKLAILDPGNIAWKVQLTNIYATAGKWSEAQRVRAAMKDSGMKKQTGWSCLEMGGRKYQFMVADTRHPESSRIYEMLDGLTAQMNNADLVESSFIFEQGGEEEMVIA